MTSAACKVKTQSQALSSINGERRELGNICGKVVDFRYLNLAVPNQIAERNYMNS